MRKRVSLIIVYWGFFFCFCLFVFYYLFYFLFFLIGKEIICIELTDEEKLASNKNKNNFKKYNLFNLLASRISVALLEGDHFFLFWQKKQQKKILSMVG